MNEATELSRLRALLDTMPMDSADQVMNAVGAGQLDPEDEDARELASWMHDAAAVFAGHGEHASDERLRALATTPSNGGEELIRGSDAERLPFWSIVQWEHDRTDGGLRRHLSTGWEPPISPGAFYRVIQSAYAAKAGPAAARGYADGWNARRAHEEGLR